MVKTCGNTIPCSLRRFRIEALKVAFKLWVDMWAMQAQCVFLLLFIRFRSITLARLN
jgi:hypothetical protein